MSAPKMQPTTQKPEPSPLVSRKEITPPPIPVLPPSGPSDEQSLRSYERAALQLFQQNFNLLFQQVAQWVANQKQQQQEMELTLGKVRSFAELAERIVNASDSQLEKLVVVTEALITLYERIQNPPQNQGG